MKTTSGLALFIAIILFIPVASPQLSDASDHTFLSFGLPFLGLTDFGVHAKNDARLVDGQHDATGAHKSLFAGRAFRPIDFRSAWVTGLYAANDVGQIATVDFDPTTYRFLSADSDSDLFPRPDIKANSQDNSVTIRQTDNLAISVLLDPGAYSGQNADWWLALETPFGWYHYDAIRNQWSWQPGLSVTYHGPLQALPQVEILNISNPPIGSYTFYFGVDMNMNGLLTSDTFHYAKVEVTIYPSHCSGGGINEGCIFDGSYQVGKDVPVEHAKVTIEEKSTYTDISGYYKFEFIPDSEAEITIEADGHARYIERYSRSVNGAFYLIPSGDVYRDFGILTWDYESSNPNNWHRKWDRQPEFFVIKNEASEQQVSDLINILQKDEFKKMTGGLYHSNVDIKVLDRDQFWTPNEKQGKIKIYFGRNINSGGIAHSEDGGDGIIDYAEVGWDTNQMMSDNVVWHELSHTVTAGGHINYRQSVNSETMGGGQVFPEDEKVFNCIYNSPPKRTN